MWDRLLVDCNIATLQGVGLSLGIIDNGAIGIADGNIVRVGKRTELAGYRARKVDALGGAWVTPGLIDCHTHLIFGGNRADEHAMRRAGASYEEIAKAGGGIARERRLPRFSRDTFRSWFARRTRRSGRCRSDQGDDARSDGGFARARDQSRYGYRR